MAAKFKSMHQIRQILQLYLAGKQLRTISRLKGISRNTIKHYLGKVSCCKQEIAALLAQSDEALQIRLQNKETATSGTLSNNRYSVLEPLLHDYAASLQSVGVTRKLLWTEYKTAHNNGYGYTQFCEHLQRYCKRQKAVMHFDNSAGEVL